MTYTQHELEILAHLSNLTDDEMWCVIQNLHHNDRRLIAMIRLIIKDTPNLQKGKIIWRQY